MKKFVLLLMICCLLTACGAKSEAVADAPAQATNSITVTEAPTEATDGEVVVEEAAEGVTVSPLPATIDINALDNCMVAVSFEKGDAYVDDAGVMQLDVTVYTYDLYDMVEIANLAEGDTIVIQGQDVVVTSLETIESGILLINGGTENGGYDLWHNDSGVYFEQGYDDAKAYYALGSVTIPVSAACAIPSSRTSSRSKTACTPTTALPSSIPPRSTPSLPAKRLLRNKYTQKIRLLFREADMFFGHSVT